MLNLLGKNVLLILFLGRVIVLWVSFRFSFEDDYGLFGYDYYGLGGG